jgi:hypothetical protein
MVLHETPVRTGCGSNKGKLAGELGFEPRSSVLETDSLTVELTPPSSKAAYGMSQSPIPSSKLLGFLVIRVLAARIAKLRELEAASSRLLILRRRIVPVLALGALQCDDFAHLCILTDFSDLCLGREILRCESRRELVPAALTKLAAAYLMISEMVPAPTVRPPSRIAKRKPFSIATGVCSVISS